MLTAGWHSAAIRTAWTTSAVPEQRATRAGRRSTSPFQTRRARSYSGWSGSISVPEKPEPSAWRSSRAASAAGVVCNSARDADTRAPVHQRDVDTRLAEDLRPELVHAVLARPHGGIPVGRPDDVVADEQTAGGELRQGEIAALVLQLAHVD